MNGTIANTTELREAILDQTESLIMRFGFGKVSVGDIAHAAGVSRATVYNHFRSKEGIFAAYMERWLLKVQRSLAAIAESPAPAAKRLRGSIVVMVERFVDDCRRIPTIPDEYFADFRGTEEWKAPVYEVYREAITRILRQGIAANEFAGMDTTKTTEAVLCAIKGMQNEFLVNPPNDAIEQRAGELADVLLHGIAVPARSETRSKKLSNSMPISATS